MKIFKTKCLLSSQLPNTHACSSAAQDLAESSPLGSHFRENFQQTHFSVVLPVSGPVSLQQSPIESNKLNFMMKYYFDFLPTKFEPATAEVSPFLYNRVESFSVGRTGTHTRDLKLEYLGKIQTQDQPEFFKNLQGFADCSM